MFWHSQSISIALGTSLVTTLAISTVIWSALSAKIGKRPVYLVASVFMFIGVIISSEGTCNSDHLLVGRC